ncbi:MAG: hypothetical protein ABIJ21_04465 [Nanoarchaeota archaeon]
MRKFLDTIVKELDDKVKEAFDKHLKLSSKESKGEMRQYKFEKLGMGTKKYFEDVYYTTTNFAKKEGLIGKTDDESVVKILEKYVFSALEGLGAVEKHDIAFYKAKVESKQFKTPKEKLGALLGMMKNNLNVNQYQMNNLISGLKQGDEEVFYDVLEKFSDQVQETVINKRIEKDRTSLEDKYGAKAFNAYIHHKLGKEKKLGMKPDRLAELLEAEVGQNVDVYHNAIEETDKKRLKALGLEPLKDEKDKYKK